LTSDSGLAVPLLSWYYAANQYLVLNFTSTMAVQQNAQLQIQFSATLTAAPLSGLYLAYYTNSTGQRVNMATTQFESIGARRAFPCFDEPAFKSTFTITIHANQRYPTVLSNMNVTSQTASVSRPGWLTTRFAPTVVMSSYLVAMVVSDYQYTEEWSQCGTRSIPSRVYAPAHRMNETIVPAKIAAAQISYYCSYFAIEYPLPKEDHIYIPQFSAGAMENWGLITSVKHAAHHTLIRPHPSSASSTPVPVCLSFRLCPSLYLLHLFFLTYSSHYHHLMLSITFSPFPPLSLPLFQLRRDCSVVVPYHQHCSAAAACGRCDRSRVGSSVVW
jgi:hypothetical protein